MINFHSYNQMYNIIIFTNIYKLTSCIPYTLFTLDNAYFLVTSAKRSIKISSLKTLGGNIA